MDIEKILEATVEELFSFEEEKYDYFIKFYILNSMTKLKTCDIVRITF